MDPLLGLADVTRVFWSFPEVTGPAQHPNYNAWHQLDHLPQNKALRAVRHGERTRELGRRPELAWTRRRVTGFASPVRGSTAAGTTVSAGAVPLLPHAGVVLEVAREPTATEEWAEVPGLLGAWQFQGLGRLDGTVLRLGWCAEDPLRVLPRMPPPAASQILRTPLLSIRPGAWDWFED